VSSPVERATALTIGTVESVSPGEIRVLLDLDAPQSVALNSGQPQKFPRINGFVLIPNEAGATVAIVSWLGIERSAYPKRPGLRDFGLVDLPYPLRKMTLVPLGTLSTQEHDGATEYDLKRGVAGFPSVGDPVYLPTADQLEALVEARGVDRRVRIGRSPLGNNTPVSIDPDKLFGRHLAVLGNTGSGKSCSVAGLIRWSIEAARAQSGKPRANARFIILDPNGEYRKSFDDLGPVRIFEVTQSDATEAPPATPLRVPAWIWNSHEWAAFTQAAPGTQRPLLMQALRNMRAGASLESGPELRLARLLSGYRVLVQDRIASGPSAYAGAFNQKRDCGVVLATLVTDVVTYRGRAGDRDAEIDALTQTTQAILTERHFTWNDTFGYNAFSEAVLTAVVDAIDVLLIGLPSVDSVGGPSEDAPLEFDPSEMASHLEILAGSQEFSHAAAWVGTLALRVRSLLADTRLAEIVGTTDSSFADWLDDYIGVDDAATGEITVVDLSMVPAEVLHLVVTVMARVVFEATQRYRRRHGTELPTVIVLEEAHTFVRRQVFDDVTSMPAQMCRETFERIAREGRKFGLGLVLSSQRPSELSPTVLAQCNTFLLHRLVNDQDQQLVSRLVPDSLGGLLSELPSLPSQQAVLLGWATPVPLLVQMTDLPLEHRPHSADPSFWDVWTGEQTARIDWAPIADDWSGTSQPHHETGDATGV
jgi:DNA helicase HerA-like ATPase